MSLSWCGFLHQCSEVLSNYCGINILPYLTDNQSFSLNVFQYNNPNVTMSGKCERVPCLHLCMLNVLNYI